MPININIDDLVDNRLVIVNCGFRQPLLCVNPSDMNIAPPHNKNVDPLVWILIASADAKPPRVNSKLHGLSVRSVFR